MWSEKQELTLRYLEHERYREVEEVLFGGSAGGGKIVADEGVVLTAFGWKKGKYLKVGDRISHPSGNTQKIVQITPKMTLDKWIVEFRDGTSTEVAQEHLWQAWRGRKSVKRNNQKINGYESREVVETKALKEWIDAGYTPQIPVCSEISFNKTSNEKNKIDPYLLGVFLGDGTITNNNPVITCHNKDKKHYKKYFNKGFSYRSGNTIGLLGDFRIHIVEKLKAYKLHGTKSHTKFIPERYKWGNVEDRYSVVQGLMDTDGHSDSNKNGVYFDTTSKDLASDMAFIIRSLGGIVTITKGAGSYRCESGEIIECKDVYHLYIRHPNPNRLFRMKRKQHGVFGKNLVQKAVTNVYVSGKITGRCITVSNPDGLYVTNDFIVTHNSFLGTMWQIARRIKYPGTRGLIGRATLKKLKLTTLRTYDENWDRFFKGKQDVDCKTNHQDNVIYFNNGSEIILMDLSYMPSDPDFSRLGSLELTDAFIDEVSELTEKAYNMLNSRIRYRLINDVAKCLGASNPANNWLKTNFVSDENNVPVKLPPYRKFVPSLVTDNPNKEFVKAYVRKLERLPLYDRKRLLEGDWSIRENDRPFFDEFNRDFHVTDLVSMDEWSSLVFAFDFNVDPTTCIVFQAELPEIKILDCIHVKGGTRELCEVLKDEYGDHPAGIVCTGDNSGYASSTSAGLRDGVAITDFAIIKEVLGLTGYDIKRPSKVNPKHIVSRKIINYALKHLNIKIHSRCKVLIEDLINAQATEKGKLLKDREANKQDAGDAFRYGMHYILPRGIKTINEYINED